MEFHPDNCKALKVTNKRKVIKCRYLLHNVILKGVSNSKYLVVTLTKRDNFCKRNLVACKPETKLQCYESFIRPTVEYSRSVWDPVGHNQLTKQTESVQAKAAQ